MGKYRSRLQIVADMLSVVSGNDYSRKTRIMYLANLSWDLLNRYLDNLLESGLLSCDSLGCYVLTRKGKQFLHRINEYSKHCEEVNEHLNDLDKERKDLETLCFNAKKSDER